MDAGLLVRVCNGVTAPQLELVHALLFGRVRQRMHLQVPQRQPVRSCDGGGLIRFSLLLRLGRLEGGVLPDPYAPGQGIVGVHVIVGAYVLQTVVLRLFGLEVKSIQITIGKSSLL